jgi:hypothetical protein
MLKTWRHKPYRPFFIVGILSLVVAFTYSIFLPDAYFDLSLKEYHMLSNFHIWLVFAGFVFLLSAIYYIAAKKQLRTYKLLVRAHFIFVILFLLFFLLFSTFNISQVQSLVSGIPFFVLVTIYGTIFILDIFFFITGLLLLLFNIFSVKKN